MKACDKCGEWRPWVIDMTLPVGRMRLCFDCAADLAEALFFAVVHLDEMERGQKGPERVM